MELKVDGNLVKFIPKSDKEREMLMEFFTDYVVLVQSGYIGENDEMTSCIFRLYRWRER